MRVIMFQPQFVEKIREGKKASTIRNKARCKPSDVLSLRTWEDKPYRSKQRLILAAVCSAVLPLKIRCEGGCLWFFLKGKLLGPTGEMELAIKEGFENAHEMKAWFRDNKKLKTGDVYEGELIEW